jgi:hypothetical protein
VNTGTGGSLSLLQAALQLAEERGLPVFPCREKDEWVNGELREAKSPLTLHGFKDATTNLDVIERLWVRRDDAVIDVPAGPATGLLVIDVDPDGMPWYRERLDQFKCGRIHHTRRGLHLVYRYPAGKRIRSTTDKLAPGVDVRAEGGYVIWWPACGLQTVGNLEDRAEAPPWLIDLIEQTQRQDADGAGNRNAAVGREGLYVASARNNFLSGRAYNLRKKGSSVEQLFVVLAAMNEAYCRPPLEESEVRKIAAGKAILLAGEGDHAAGASDWQPPAVVTYGASFDPAKIPLRRWLIGNRRSLGEVTQDVGPPGVSKSTLVLTDAVAIVTGRPILADAVHESGAVLYLAGEDARRDVEARIAGICRRHNISPAELADRLHVFYLTELKDPSTYTLASMIEDVAVLNANMMQWLRDYPNVIAILLDPLIGWHQLIERSNEALQFLASRLRALAVQTGRHIGFDHHTNKAAQSDPEGHVRNPAAARGAGSLVGDIRWNFTLACLRLETGRECGIPEEELWRYRRLDGLKANYGANPRTMRLLRVESVVIPNGESVPVLTEVDMERTREDAEKRKAAEQDARLNSLAGALTRMLIEHRPRSVQATAQWLMVHAPDIYVSAGGKPLGLSSIRDRLPKDLGIGLSASPGNGQQRIVWRPSESAGKPAQIDFEQGQT